MLLCSLLLFYSQVFGALCSRTPCVLPHTTVHRIIQLVNYAQLRSPLYKSESKLLPFYFLLFIFFFIRWNIVVSKFSNSISVSFHNSWRINVCVQFQTFHLFWSNKPNLCLKQFVLRLSEHYYHHLTIWINILWNLRSKQPWDMYLAE